MHHHVISHSPLWHHDHIHRGIQPDPSAAKLRDMEEGFVLDCIQVEKVRYKWSADIIPKYDALVDPHASHFFHSPMVRGVIGKTLGGKYLPNIWQPDPIRPFSPLVPTRQSRSPTRCSLSARRRTPRSQSEGALRQRENDFVVDSVCSTNQVTNRKPLINSYDALSDKHASGYFRRPRVKAVLDFTLMKTPKATKRDWNLSPRTSTPGRKRSVTW
eukprot:XP_011672745.1 PREDICTED: uncharacterized protein LOC755292 [Strongylocentrotus purpuratus]